MSDEVMEALDSGTSSESECDTPLSGSPLKDLKSPKHTSPTPIADDSPDSGSDLCLTDKAVKVKSIIKSDTDDENVRLKNKVLKQSSKPTALVITNDDSNSSDAPLIKFVGSAKKNESKTEKETASAGSSSTKKKLKVISESDSSSGSSDATIKLVKDTSTDSDSIDQVCEIPKSKTKKTPTIIESTKKVNLKRKRSGESDAEEGNSKTKRKLDILSDSDTTDEIAKGKSSVPAVPASRKKKTSPTTNKKNKPDSVSIKKKSVPASSKKNSSVQNESGPIVSPTKSIDLKNKTPNSKLSDPKRTKKLDASDIMERLDDSSKETSASSSSSEDVEMEEPQDAEKNSGEKSSSDSDDEDSDAVLTSFKGKKKILQQKKANSSKNSTSSESDSDSDSSSNSPAKNATKKAKGKSGPAAERSESKDSSSSSSEQESENVSPKKKKTAITPAKNAIKKTKGKSGPAAERSETKSSSSSSSEQESENVSPKKKKKASKTENSAKKESKKDDKKKVGSKIVRLQKYLKAAGIRVQKYETLWQGCKSEKARAEKLLELLRERGLVGNPSLAACKKLKRKYEKEKEISELNLSNIIASNGRSRRGSTNPFVPRRSCSPQSTKKQETSPKSSPEFKKKMFGRLRNIVDSEDSD